MGVTITYKGRFRDHYFTGVERFRKSLENIAIDAAKRWSYLLGLEEPDLLVYSNQAAIVEFGGGAESFHLWQTTDETNSYDWDGMTKTQYLESPLTHVQICMTIKEIIDSGLFDPDTIVIDDEGEYFGNWFFLDNLLASLRENAKVLDEVFFALQTLGWKAHDIHGQDSTVNATTREVQIFKAAIEYGLNERDFKVYKIAEKHARLYRLLFEEEFNLMKYPFIEHRLRDLQADLVVWLYRWNNDQLNAFISGQAYDKMIYDFTFESIEVYLAKIKSWWKPEYAESVC
jgi:hypothetical protein